MAATKRICCGFQGQFWAHNTPKCHENDKKLNRMYNPDTLLEICAKIVAENITFQTIEERFVRIPEPVQSRIVYWSFPRNERDICMYSSLSTAQNEEDENEKLPFQQGVKLLEQGAVGDALQIGFHLSGTVTEPANPLLSLPEQVYKVSISFDRCKITAVKCGCGSRDIFWCQHVVALSLYRIRMPSRVQLRLPISETLYQMNREQLQKFIQYLISEHHTDVLPTAQKLADEILESDSEINKLPGAPDPTAGASIEDDNSWHLDEEQVCEQVKSYLAKGNFTSSSDHLASMFAKVREMLKVRDSNGARMLTLITEQFLADSRLVAWQAQGAAMSDKCRQLWDKLSSLWVCVVLNPSSSEVERETWQKQLKSWVEMDVCPLENPDQTPSNHNHHNHHHDGENGQPRMRTIFHRALEASHLSWDDSHLQFILKGSSSCCSKHKQQHRTSDPNLFTSQGLPMWHEHIPTACVRVDALRSHGYYEGALRLAVAIVRSMKQKQLDHQQYYQWIRHSGVPPMDSDQGTMVMYNRDGWVGHLLDPIGCLYDVLTEASLITQPECSGPLSGDWFQTHTFHESAAACAAGSSTPQTRYQHKLIPHSNDRNESYLTLAYEAALIGLGQQRVMPRGMYAQDKVIKQEQRLINCLQELELDATLVSVLRHQTVLLLEGGPCSGLGVGIHTESVPMHTFAKYLYKSLLPYDAELAFRVGLRAIRLPVLEAIDRDDMDDPNSNNNNQGQGPGTRWFTMSHIETQQYELGAMMISAARDDVLRLRTVMDATMCHIHGAAMLYKLAQETLKMATLSDRPRHMPLLNAAFELGLKVMRKTLSTSIPSRQRQEMVHWLVSCATELGFDALLSLVRNWKMFFTPVEATGTVAVTIMSQQTLLQLGLDYPRQEELATCTRTLALQCATKDPPNCAYTALTLCEKERGAFEACYQIILGATESVLNSDKLFNIARYMEHRNNPHRAYKLAYIAMKKLHIAYNEDRHPAINNIHWACGLSYALGKEELQNMVLLVVKNVQCADVLVDVLHRCTLTAPSIMTASGKSQPVKLLSYDKPPLCQLLEAAIRAYINTTHSRLTHISPSRYGDFIEFLSKARETFLLAQDGHIQFARLIEDMKLVYKGKKKLMFLIKERFGM